MGYTAGDTCACMATVSQSSKWVPEMLHRRELVSVDMGVEASNRCCARTSTLVVPLNHESQDGSMMGLEQLQY